MRTHLFLSILCGVLPLCFSLQESNTLYGSNRNKLSQGSKNDCKVEEIAPVDNFDMNQFKGDWFVTHKMVGGFKDFNNGMWKFYYQAENIYGFYYSGRIGQYECIRPISGRTEQRMFGVIDLIYRTYSFKVREKINVIYTDYTTVAVIYACHHITSAGKCHAAGVHVEIWSRTPSIQDSFQEEVLTAINKACVNIDSIIPQKIGEHCSIDGQGGGDPFQILAPEFCYLPPKIGSCKSSILRYFYNPKSGQCEKFTYGGCNGNNNNFAKYEECKTTCMRVTSDPSCKTVAKCGITCPPCCKELSGCLKCDCDSIIVDDFHQCMPNTNQCPSYCKSEQIFKGCMKCSCENVSPKANNICRKPPASGNCDKSSVKFFYNPSLQKCEEFIYNGCGGNENNFETEEECEKICQGVLQNERVKEINPFEEVLSGEEPREINPFQEICVQPQKVGTCQGRRKRYYYSAQEGVCKPFYFSGCGGNKNNFYKEIQCYEKCNGTKLLLGQSVKENKPDHANVIAFLPSLLVSLLSCVAFYYRLI